MWLDAYLDRIGYRGRIQPTLDCLVGVHRGHALSIPYENLDIQLGRPVDRDIGRIVDKLVTRRRGGWCYEMNTLLAHALKAIGFDVRPVTGAIHRFERGDAAFGNHMLMLVALDRPYIADLGLADGLRAPVPLAEGTHQQGALTFGLARLDDGYWRFTNHAGGYPVSFDFSEEPIDEGRIDAFGHKLQTSPESIFVQNLIVQQMRESSILCLTGRVFEEKFAPGGAKRLIRDETELETVLAEAFGIRDPGIRQVWPRVEARHRVVFGDRDVAEISTGAFGRGEAGGPVGEKPSKTG